MKPVLLLLTICVAFANAQFYYDKHGESRGAYKDSLEYSKLVELAKRFRGPILVKKPVDGVKPRKNLEKIPENKIQRTFNVSRNTLNKEKWLEVEKNEIVKICVDAPVVAWETSLNSSILNDSCLAFQAPMYVGVESIDVYLPESDSPHKINLAIDMKYLDFKNEEALLGFSKKTINNDLYPQEDPERLISITGAYLVDKYPITNCEFTQLMLNNITPKPSFSNSIRQEMAKKWADRKKIFTQKRNCITHDSAACTIFLSQAMEYANARSIREGLKPYYIFTSTDYQDPRILSNKKYIIAYFDFSKKEDKYVQISIDPSSDGYRLPFYNEWMMFARGRDKKKNAPWGDTTATFEEASEFAVFDSKLNLFGAEPVGQLKPNGFGLYDMFGLVWEHVLFEDRNPFRYLDERPSCLKGGDNHTRRNHIWNEYYSDPYWKWINYGYTYPNYSGGATNGFRLIRNIGNNAKWERKDSIVDDKSVDDLKNKELHTNDSLVNSEPDKDSVSDNEKLKERKVLDVKVSNVFIGRCQLGGYVGAVTPIFPIMDSIPVPWFRHYLSGSKLARAIKFKVEKNSLTRNRTMWVRISLVKEDGSLYDFNTSVDVEFYRIGEERDKYIFQSTKMFKDKAILFTRNEKDIGNFKEAVVLCIKKNSDKFAFQLLE